MRHLSRPSISVEPLRRGAFVILLAVLMFFSFANLWFYTTLAFQYIYGMSVLESAVAMIPAQVTAIAGAALAGRLVQRLGVARAGFMLVVAVAVSLWLSMIVSSDGPVWLPIVTVSIYALLAVGAGVPITTAIMGSVRKGEEGDASAYRGAATNLGNALSVAFMTSIVAATISLSVRSEYAAAGMDPATVPPIAKDIQAGAAAQQLSSEYSMTVAQVQSIDAMQVQAFVDGYRMQGLVGGFVTLVVAFVFYWVARRRESATLP